MGFKDQCQKGVLYYLGFLYIDVFDFICLIIIWEGDDFNIDEVDFFIILEIDEQEGDVEIERYIDVWLENLSVDFFFFDEFIVFCLEYVLMDVFVFFGFFIFFFCFFLIELFDKVFFFVLFLLERCMIIGIGRKMYYWFCQVKCQSLIVFYEI